MILLLIPAFQATNLSLSFYVKVRDGGGREKGRVTRCEMDIARVASVCLESSAFRLQKDVAFKHRGGGKIKHRGLISLSFYYW